MSIKEQIEEIEKYGIDRYFQIVQMNAIIYYLQSGLTKTEIAKRLKINRTTMLFRKKRFEKENCKSE